MEDNHSTNIVTLLQVSFECEPRDNTEVIATALSKISLEPPKTGDDISTYLQCPE